MDYAPDGDLSRFTADDVADAIDWQGDASEFMGALRVAQSISAPYFQL